MASCLFCRIVAGEVPSKKIFEDDHIVAFDDIAPKAPTHVLIIPRKHVAKLGDASPDDASLLGEVALRAAAVARARGLEDFRLVVNNGEGAGQSVFHLHFHLLGGRSFSWPPGKTPKAARRPAGIVAKGRATTLEQAVSYGVEEGTRV